MGVLMEELAVNYPETIEEGMMLLQREIRTENGFVDALMLDSNKDTVAVELKYRSIDITSSDISKFEEGIDADRFVVAINEKADITDRDSFDERGLEVITIDPYAAFGKLSTVVRIIDNYADVVGFKRIGLA